MTSHDCKTCRHKSICKYVSDMDKLLNIKLDLELNPDSPVSLETRCNHYVNEVAIRGNPIFR